MEERSFDELVDATCPSCRHEVPMGANVCPNCGYRLRTEGRKVPPVMPTIPTATVATRSGISKAFVGGIFVMISGLIGIVEGVWIASVAGELSANLERMLGGTFTGIESVFVACGVIWIIIGLVALIGGFFAFRKKHWGIAILGGVFALFTLGIVFFEGSILGLIGLILIAISKDEFS